MSKVKALTNVEKYTIAGMIADRKTAKEIAKTLGKDIEQIEKYLGRLDKLAENIVKEDNPPKTKKKAKKELVTEGTSEDIVAAVVRRLKKAGLSERDSSNLVETALKLADKTNKVFESDDELYTACIKRINAGNLMVKKTDGGREGVCMMTGAASAKMDGARKKTVSRTARGNMWDIKKGKLIE